MMIPHIIHKFCSLFGYSVEIRIQSPEFQSDLRRLARLADNKQQSSYTAQYERMCAKYGANDPELIRCSTLADFLFGSD
jgi:hypothetical protein